MQNKNRSLIYLVRRYAFLALLMFAVTFFMVPFRALITFNEYTSEMREAAMSEYEQSVAFTYDLTKQISSVVSKGVNQEILAFGFAGMGFLSAIVLFRHLFSRRLTILNASLPVSRQRDYLERTAVFLINCLLPTALCLLLYPLFVRLTGLGQFMTGKVWLQIGTLLLIEIYGFALGTLSAVVTGQLFACAALTLFFGIFIETVAICWEHISYRYFYTVPADVIMPAIRQFSPAFSLYKTLGHPDLFTPWAGILCTAICLILGYIAYGRRPAERTEHTIAFTGLERPLAVLISLTAGSAIGVIFMNIIDTEATLIIALLAGAVLVSMLCSLIFSLNFRRLKAGIPTGIVCAAALLLTAMIFRFDIFGYDRYTPDPAKLSQITVESTNVSGTMELYTVTGTDTRTAACTLADMLRDDSKGEHKYHSISPCTVKMTFGSGLFKKVRAYAGGKNAAAAPDPDAWVNAARTLIESDEYKQGVLDVTKIDMFIDTLEKGPIPYFSMFGWEQLYGMTTESINAYMSDRRLTRDWTTQMPYNRVAAFLKVLRETILKRTYETVQQDSIYIIQLYGMFDGKYVSSEFPIYPDETDLLRALGGDRAVEMADLLAGNYAKVINVKAYKVSYSAPITDLLQYPIDKPVSWQQAESPEQAAEWIRNSISQTFSYVYARRPVSNEEIWLFYSGPETDLCLESVGLSPESDEDYVKLVVENDILEFWPNRRNILIH